tara:strand:+ start:955 stop:1227 length:273 start_codon:yes stop_codon:yes gene_type:complete
MLGLVHEDRDAVSEDTERVFIPVIDGVHVLRILIRTEDDIQYPAVTHCDDAVTPISELLGNFHRKVFTLGMVQPAMTFPDDITAFRPEGV